MTTIFVDFGFISLAYYYLCRWNRTNIMGNDNGIYVMAGTISGISMPMGCVGTKQCTLWHITYKQRKKKPLDMKHHHHHCTRPFTPTVNSNEFGSISIPWLHIFGRRPYSDNARFLTIVAMNTQRGLVVRSPRECERNKREKRMNERWRNNKIYCLSFCCAPCQCTHTVRAFGK